MSCVHAKHCTVETVEADTFCLRAWSALASAKKPPRVCSVLGGCILCHYKSDTLSLLRRHAVTAWFELLPSEFANGSHVAASNPHNFDHITGLQPMHHPHDCSTIQSGCIRDLLV